MKPDSYLWAMIAVIAAVTAATRFLPFLIFRSGKKTPPAIEGLGRILPFAIMGMLVVYCLRTTSFFVPADIVPAAVSCLLVVLLHIWKRNTLLSIVGGTLCYMLFVQVIF